MGGSFLGLCLNTVVYRWDKMSVWNLSLIHKNVCTHKNTGPQLEKECRSLCTFLVFSIKWVEMIVVSNIHKNRLKYFSMMLKIHVLKTRISRWTFFCSILYFEVIKRISTLLLVCGSAFLSSSVFIYLLE